MHTPPGDPRQGFPPLFSVAARKGRQQVCTRTGRADNPTWVASAATLTGFPGASNSMPERGPPRLYHVAKSVLSERGRNSAEGCSGKEKRGWREELRKEGRCQCLDIKEKHPTSFSGVSSACRRSSLLTITIKLETPAPPSNPSSPKGQKDRVKVRTHRREMILFGSADSVSLDRAGDRAAGDLQTFFFSSTPFSASELEKTLHLRYPEWGGGKNDDVTSLSGEWNDLQCLGLAEVNKDSSALSIPPSYPLSWCPRGWSSGSCLLQIHVQVYVQVNVQLCRDFPAPRYAARARRCLALPSPAWRWKITQKLGGPLTCARAHVRPPASCEPFCWALPPRLFALTSLIIFCCSYIGPGLGAC